MAIDYKEAGVDIKKGEALVEWLKDSENSSPHADKIVDGIGGFASIFQMKFPDIVDPCLVSATDGVGTKLKLAIDLGRYDGLGQDLVAMCANDLICTGAQPLFFLDYFATSKLDLSQTQPFLKGLRQACHQVGMALIGGETAEMPGLYQKGDFDCAGFAVGIVGRDQILGAKKVLQGDRIMGLASSGFHSNGYSLVRKLFADELEEFGDELIEPTVLYVQSILAGLAQGLEIHAMAHITGGGIHNISRVLPDNLRVRLQDWQWPQLFKEAQTRSELSDQKMLETFNCGIGMALIVSEKSWKQSLQYFQEQGLEPVDLGVVEPREDGEALILPEGRL